MLTFFPDRVSSDYHCFQYADDTYADDAFLVGARKKAAGKELKWKDLLEIEKPFFRASQQKEWEQWLRLGAATILTPEETA